MEREISELHKRINDNPKYQFTLEDYYLWYEKYKRFAFTITNKTFEAEEIDDFTKQLNEYKKRYSYISRKLEGAKKSLFKDYVINHFENLSEQQELNTYKDLIQDFLNEIDNPYNEISTHPKHTPNLWNKECFDLFKYLFDNYNQGSKRSLTNIWFYLKEYKKKYVLKATKDLYKNFIKENYGIEIKNFDKAENKYNEKEYPTMNEHRINFESFEKHVKNT